jgi:hypothetical protein
MISATIEAHASTLALVMHLARRAKRRQLGLLGNRRVSTAINGLALANWLLPAGLDPAFR